jgi:hypothetical protein
MPYMSRSTGSSDCSEKETTDKISGVDAHTSRAHGGDSAESYATTRTSQEDELVSALEDCISILRSGLQQFQNISIEDLVFCEPPKDVDPLIPSPPTLQVLATTNLPFLQYHDWIMTLYSETQKLDCGSFERCGRIKHGLLEDLRKEWAKLEDLKHRAWQMTSQRSPEPGSAQITDTCEYMVINLEILFANLHLGTLSPSF